MASREASSRRSSYALLAILTSSTKYSSSLMVRACAQGVIAGANMVLVECHPRPEMALCDGPQALTMRELEYFVEDVRIARRAYEERRELASREAMKNLLK